MHRLDHARVAGKQRFDKKRFVRFDHEVDPRAGHVDPRQVADIVDDLVHLGDHDAVAEGGRFDQRRRVFRARSRVQIALAVGHVAGHHHDVRRQVDEQARIQFDIGVDGAHFQQAVLQELGDAQALRAGEREIEFAGDAAFEQVQVLGQADAGHDHVQMVDLVRVHPGQHARQKIRLLLVIAFQNDAVAGRQQRFQHGHHIALLQHRSVRILAHGVQAAPLLGAARIPALASLFALRWRLCGG